MLAAAFGVAVFLAVFLTADCTLVVLLLFGGKKIPELMKGLGKGVKSFKEGLNEGDKPEDDKKTGEEK